MERIDPKERQRLRDLARKQLVLSHSEKNMKIIRQWEALGQGRRTDPTVRLLFSNFMDEVVYNRMECQHPTARAIECQLLSTMVGRELFDDDTPISPTFDVGWKTWVNPFGTEPKARYDSTSGGYHIIEQFEELPDGMELLRGGGFGVDREGTQTYIDTVNDLIGDLLPVRMVMGSLPAMITNLLVRIMNMENYYMAMYDYEKELHQVMDMATKIYEQYYDFLEKEKLLCPTWGLSPINQESFAYNHELPSENVTKTTECWGFMESQETHAVSPKMYGEFVYPYQDRMNRHFGLLTYGCCERVDAIWEDYLSKWKNLRKLSVSPFNDERRVGEYLRGTNVVYYSKPRAEFVTARGQMDEDALRLYFKEVCQCASGCLFEMAQREVGTIYGDYERGRRYVQIARECIQTYWRP